MRRLIASMAAFGAACIASPALAGWTYAEWGMSPDEVVTASEGQVERTDYDPDNVLYENHQLAAGKTSYLDLQLDVFSYFDAKSEQLRNLDLVPEAEKFDTREALHKEFGKVEPSIEPLHLGEGLPMLDEHGWLWVDETSGDETYFLEAKLGKITMLSKIVIAQKGVR